MGEKNINEHVLVRKPQFTLTPGALKNFICTGGSSPELGRVQSFTTEVTVVAQYYCISLQGVFRCTLKCTWPVFNIKELITVTK